MQQPLVKTGGRLVKYARYYCLFLAEGDLKRRRFGAMLGRIVLLPLRIVSQCREQARRMYYGAVFEIKSLLASVVSVGPESRGKDFVARQVVA